MCGPQVRFCERCGGASPRAYSTKAPTRERCMSSEFRGTINVNPATGVGLPTLTHHFLEFVAKEKWEAHAPEFLTLDQIREGEEYYIFVTTDTGLYRYHMNDIVKVTGTFFKTPTLQFVQKGRGVTNITGETLYESQVIRAVKEAEAKLGFVSNFFTMLADETRAVYSLYLEPSRAPGAHPKDLGRAIERCLEPHNMEYRDKRASGRLKPLEVFRLRPGAGEAFKRYCVRHGQRESQFKNVALQYKAETGFPIDQYVFNQEDLLSLAS